MDDEIRLAIAVRDVVRAVERYRTHSARHHLALGVTETVALGHLYANGPLTASELATELAITSASATELVDRIERAGFAARAVHPTDRRKRLVTLTDRGQQEVTRIYRDLGKQLSSIYNAVPFEQRRGIDYFLAAVSANLTPRIPDDT